MRSFQTFILLFFAATLLSACANSSSQLYDSGLKALDEENYSKATEKLESAYKKGNNDALTPLIKIYKSEDNQDLERAFELASIRANLYNDHHKDDVNASMDLSIMLALGEGTDANIDKAIEELEQHVDANPFTASSAQQLLGYIYAEKSKTDPSAQEQAAYWLISSVEEHLLWKHYHPWYALAVMYYQRKDYTTALNYASYYIKRENLDFRFDKYERPLLHFFNEGYPEASLALAVHYSTAQGSDFALSQAYFREAIEEGLPLAAYLYAGFLFRYDMPEDGAKMMLRAAELGYTFTYNDVATYYLDGKYGFDQDNEKANFWATKALDANNIRVASSPWTIAPEVWRLKAQPWLQAQLRLIPPNASDWERIAKDGNGTIHSIHRSVKYTPRTKHGYPNHLVLIKQDYRRPLTKHPINDSTLPRYSYAYFGYDIDCKDLTLTKSAFQPMYQNEAVTSERIYRSNKTWTKDLPDDYLLRIITRKVCNA